jgi:hypothetical protein
MPVYTVHEPPLKAGEASADPDRFVFVRDRFAFWAFLLTPLWLLVKRLWLVLLLYVLLNLALALTFYFAGVSSLGRFCVTMLISLLVGLEASTLQRWTLARRKWKQTGTVVADNQDEAERRFFAQWIARRDTPPVTEVPPSSFSPPVINPPRSDNHPLGLFPNPGAR